MKTIYKYTLQYHEGFKDIEAPIAKILTAQLQYNTITIWAEIDTLLPNKKYRFIYLGTGWNLTDEIDEYTYLSTVQQASGSLIWHIYYKELVEQ